jgi:F-type H+-transporting ATPase subunit delta
VVVKGYPKRYARAIFEIALEQNTIDIWQSDLDKMSSLRDDKTLLLLLENPRLTFEDKKRLLAEYLTGMSPMAHNFAYLLTERNRMGLLNDIQQQYTNLVDAHNGVAHASVTTAVPLEPLEQDKIVQTIECLTGKIIGIYTRVNPEIIGGFIARIDGTLLDGSTRSKLMALKKDLSGASR